MFSALRRAASPALSLLLAVPLLLAAGPAGAQEGSAAVGRPSITVTGESTVTVLADQARLDLGVITQAATSREAASRNAERLERVVAALRRTLRPGTSIETVGYSLQPDYRYPERGGQPTITGYTATNIVRVTVDELQQVGPAIDAGIAAGANNVQGLQFTLRDEQGARARALREAATRARAKGDALAQALGLRVVRVFHVREEPTQIVRPFQTAVALEKSQAADTPVLPGLIEVEGRVTLVLEIGS